MDRPDCEWHEVERGLAALADRADGELAWPSASWDWVRRGGALRWSVPAEYGGDGHAGAELLDRYEVLAGACLTTCFILSQRDAACRRIRDHGEETLRKELLPGLARGERFATVGLSHLTTSRQHVDPVLRARPAGEDFVLEGYIPWVTGAARADYLVTGATLPDGRQILAILHGDRPGVRVGEALDLMALAGSVTAPVRCENVLLERRWLLAGPEERILTSGRGGPGGLETSCLAIGLAGAAVQYLTQESEARPEYRPTAQRLNQVRLTLASELRSAARSGCTSEHSAALRGRANALVLRATQAALAAGKGTAFVRGHPAQRWARQALFFLVWSCPRPAAEATLAYLAPPEGPGCP